jgi:hypothetical protein
MPSWSPTTSCSCIHAGALRPGLTAQTAADILYALASPHTHQLLRRYCNWTRRRYRTWLVNVVTQQLLPDRLVGGEHPAVGPQWSSFSLPWGTSKRRSRLWAGWRAAVSGHPASPR